MSSASSGAARTIAEINRRDLTHRRGWRFSEYVGRRIALDHLRDEVDELDAVLDAVHAGDAQARAQAIDELGDVFGCVLQAAYRLGLSFAELDEAADRKLRLRFVGADAIEPS